MKREGLLIASILLTGCQSLPQLTPSELNAHPEQYDGKEISVIGYLVYEFEDVGIWDSPSAYKNRYTNRTSAINPQGCVSYSGPELGREYEDQFVILRGVFRKNILPPGFISDANCNDSGVEVEGHTLGR